jgi:carbon storage regulator CsrA
MLVLKRRIGEGLVLRLADGRTVRLEVLDAGRHGLRLGIEAPADVHVLREELCTHDAKGTPRE